MLGERLGVGGADSSAVGVAEIGQLVVAQRRADGIQIPGDSHGPDIAQETPADLGDTAGHELLGFVLDVRHTRRAVVDIRLLPQPVVVGIGVAPDRGPRYAHPARVEADQIEAFPDPLRQRLNHTQGGFDAGLTGASGLMTSEPILSPVAGKRIIASAATSLPGWL